MKIIFFTKSKNGNYPIYRHSSTENFRAHDVFKIIFLQWHQRVQWNFSEKLWHFKKFLLFLEQQIWCLKGTKIEKKKLIATLHNCNPSCEEKLTRPRKTWKSLKLIQLIDYGETTAKGWRRTSIFEIHLQSYQLFVY